MLLKNKEIVQFDEYRIDRPRWLLQWRDDPLTINRKSFDLLLYLIDHRDRVVAKQELLNALWPGQFVEESNLSQHVFLLRKVLSRHASATRIIETVPGRGYRFTAAVLEETPTQNQVVIGISQSTTRITIEEEHPDGEIAALPAATPLQIASPKAPSRRYVAIAAAVLCVLCALGWFAWQRWQNHTTGSPVDVVLTPFDGTTGDPILDHALVDALRMDLIQSPFVSVVPSATVRATLTQMMHKPDDPMTPAMAREVCERTNSQTVLHGTIARFGQHFLLTEEATSCVNGAVLAQTKREAAGTEDLPHSIDKLAESIRQKLGESRRSIAHFDTPLFGQNTASLEALKDFSQSIRDNAHGNVSQAIAMSKQAVAADPNFATAYNSLAAEEFSMGEFAEGTAAITKAYSLRDQASEPARLAITETYTSVMQQDLFASERNCRNWTELYPRNGTAWNLLSNRQADLGHLSESVISSARAVALLPNSQGMLKNLALRQMQSGDPAAARATLDRAVALHLDGDQIRQDYLLLAYLIHDQALYRAQLAWGDAHPDAAWLLTSESTIALAEGRFNDSRRLIDQAGSAFRRLGAASTADSLTRLVGTSMVEGGDLEDGKQLLQSSPIDPEDGIDLAGLVDIGETARAESMLHAVLTKYPQGTVWKSLFAPRIRAGIALAAHKPAEAIALMEPTRAFDQRDLGSGKFRGDLYLAAGQPALAEKEYRGVLAHPFVDPAAQETPLAWLGLGRALAAQHRRSEAAEAYRHFLDLWAHADPNAVFLLQARNELKALQANFPR
jgi:DNA-binding winged helix-turn-helix (wHTH) protein/tetratricopeptide (TPR) repeat protein